jgi:hypothetical protein
MSQVYPIHIERDLERRWRLRAMRTPRQVHDNAPGGGRFSVCNGPDSPRRVSETIIKVEDFAMNLEARRRAEKLQVRGAFARPPAERSRV